MLLIATQSDVEARMAMGNVPMAAPVIGSALIAAHLRVATELDTEFEKQSNEDVFLLDMSKHGLIPDGFFRLKLRNSFVRADPEIVVTSGEDVDEITTAVEDTDYKLDPEKGILLVKEDYEDMYIKVVYDSGFEETDDFPDKLKEAIVAYVPAVIDFSGTVDVKRDVTKEYKAAVDHMLAVLLPYRRRIGFTLDPVF